ncbi:molybdopterin-guanine dinucleotide biosynthesis protein A [Mesorhizobium albiziae]|uniref:Molybdenum cofactor guanylyltransferase n=1 Tax=Neomesorhizobium albiziae TaxID=335020 RepID=A0A1I3YUL5_9HYPH|nr:molybdenum cofactor guanylyltransferase MobA [Mesorhizobium albiziae]GLS33274.1 molybdenum cofactor guanylyltransferase [Mesorhizobium albiziae]SFK35485.1 molybdopterin-guanine dinucleotide biosynthesis protein A [Mesorhizobium albiziae]
MSGKIPAVILAGGLSTRMGGGDKPLRPIAGRPLMAHAIGRLAPQAGALAINANGDPQRFESFGLPVIGDTVSGFAGPLAGILAGMEWAQDSESPHIVSIAGDTPFFPADMVDRMLEAAGAGEKIVLAASAGRIHPVFGLWPLGLRSDLKRFLAANRRVMSFAEAAGYVVVDFPLATAGGNSVDPFFNINTVDDLATAETICREWKL